MQPLFEETVNEEMSSIEESIQRWGGTVSEACLDPKGHFFRLPGLEGFIGYRIEAGCAVMFGDPICPFENASQLTVAFHEFCGQQKLGIVYVSVSEWFAKWMIQQGLCKVLLEATEELVFDPQSDPRAGSKGYRLRNRLSHAKSAGLTVHEYFGGDELIEEAIQEVGREWLKTRRGPQVHLGMLNFFENRQGKRWFYAQIDGKVVGMALLSRLDKREGWLIKFLIILPDLPRGSSELLMMHAFDTLQSEKCRYLTFGVIPRKEIGETLGMNKFIRWSVVHAFKIAKRIFSLDQRKTYWEKFRPKIEKSFVLFGKLGIRELRAMSRSLKIEL